MRLGGWVLSLGLAGLGALSGAVATALAVEWAGRSDWAGPNSWQTSLLAGARAADPFTRAVIARSSLLALNRQETIYYVRKTDDAGQPLDAKCTYLLSGKGLPARWWSYTLYDEAHFLARNLDNAPSIDASRVAGKGADGFVARISNVPGPEPFWISSRHGGRFELVARLYNPTSQAQADPRQVELASIAKLSCQDGKPAP